MTKNASPKVSIIIPVYNVEIYIKDCIESLVNQTLRDIELIFVDDCGNDNSMAIVEKYAKKDNRIKIVRHTKNSGLSASRNTGIEHSSAPYIMFCDSDDSYDKQMCREMLNNNNIRFTETPGASFQDMGFKPKTMIASKRFIYIPDVVLHYRKHANNSNKNNAKVFAVCDVHDDADKWFAENVGNDFRAKKILNMSRFANYIWNLRRLSGDARKQFKKRFVSDMRAQMKSKEIEYNYMDSRQRVKLKHLCMNSRFAVLSYIMHMGLLLIYKTRIHNGHTVSYLFHKFPVSKRQGF